MNRFLNAVVRGSTLLLFTLGVTFGGLPADASPVVYDFTGTATNDSGWGPMNVGGVNVGDPITGSFHYDSGLKGTVSLEGDMSYQGDVGLKLTMGSQTFDSSSAPVGAVGISHLVWSNGDRFQVSVQQNMNPVTGVVDFAELDLYNPSGTAFTDESLPTRLDLAKWTNGAIEVISSDGSFYSGNITLTAPSQVVPGPATLAIFLLGLGACAARRKAARLSTGGSQVVREG